MTGAYTSKFLYVHDDHEPEYPDDLQLSNASAFQLPPMPCRKTTFFDGCGVGVIGVEVGVGVWVGDGVEVGVGDGVGDGVGVSVGSGVGVGVGSSYVEREKFANS